MKIDSGLGPDLSTAAATAAAAEEAGYAGVWTAETGFDPFLPLAVAAPATTRLELGTGIAVAFARNPMTTAMTADNLHRASGGRFMLGLGSQIKPHIEKRFAMPWSAPAARMREFILAMRAIWDCWNDGTKLDFRGDFYSHTLMTPFFSPGPNPHGHPAVYLAAVGEKMTEVCGEVADGMLVHGFTTERYLKEVTLPALDRGLGESGRDRSALQLSLPGFVVSGATEEATAGATAAVRQQIAFYGSTPAYRPVLELHGWGDLQTELNGLSKQGRWKEMGDLVDDEVLSTFAVVAELPDLAARITERWGSTVDRFSFYAPYDTSGDGWRATVSALTA